jgi:tight adherence protein C
MVLAIAALIFACIAMLTAALLDVLRQRRVTTRYERVAGDGQLVVEGTALHSQLATPFRSRLVAPRMAGFLDAARSLAPDPYINAATRRLSQAGYPRPKDLLTFLATKLGSIVVAALGLVIVPSLIGGQMPLRLAAAATVAVFVVILPDYVLVSKARARRAQIRRALPDILDLLVVSVEAGQGLVGAMGFVVSEKTGPLPDEFARWLAEVRFGRPRVAAWQDMSERAGVVELSTLIAAIQQAERMGVSLAKTLRNQAAAIRSARSLEVRQLAATMSLKLLFPLVFFIMPALYCVILAPGVIMMREAFAIR